MLNRLVSGALRAFVMMAITLLAGGTLVCAHAGVLRLCCANTAGGFTLLGVSGGMAIAAAVLIRYRNDLADC